MNEGLSPAGRLCTCGAVGPARPRVARPTLTPRETEVLLAWLRHDTRDDAARELYITVSTVRKHLERVRDKYAALGRRASTKTELFVRALQDGLIDIDIPAEEQVLAGQRAS